MFACFVSARSVFRRAGERSAGSVEGAWCCPGCEGGGERDVGTGEVRADDPEAWVRSQVKDVLVQVLADV